MNLNLKESENCKDFNQAIEIISTFSIGIKGCLEIFNGISKLNSIDYILLFLCIIYWYL